MRALGEGQGKNDINRMVEDGILDKDLYLTSGYNNTYGGCGGIDLQRP